MTYVLVALVWLSIGAAVGVVEARHGAWRRGWVVSAVVGPFAVPLARQRRRLARAAPSVLTPSRPRRGRLALLVLHPEPWPEEAAARALLDTAAAALKPVGTAPSGGRWAAAPVG